MVLRHALQVAAVGLELLELVSRGIVAVRAATHVELLVVALERDLSFVARGAACGDGRMSLHAFLGGRRRRKAAIQIAHLCGELAQRAHRDRVGHEGTACHLTLQTATGMSCARQKLSQRIWLSCNRSPGPFTSMSR